MLELERRQICVLWFSVSFFVAKYLSAMLIIEELFRIVDAFAANQLEYAVCGGLAVAIHGRPRLTVDIDIRGWR